MWHASPYWVMSQTWMSHVTHMNDSCHPHEWVISHIWMSHVTHMNESCHPYEWFISHIWLIHKCDMPRHIESCHTHEWVMSHTWMIHVTHMNESCHTHEWVISHIWMSHVTHMNESCHPYEWVMSHIWLIHKCDMPRHIERDEVCLVHERDSHIYGNARLEARHVNMARHITFMAKCVAFTNINVTITFVNATHFAAVHPYRKSFFFSFFPSFQPP